MKVHDYHDGNLRLQERFDTRRLADRLKARVTETVFDEARAIIEEAPDVLPSHL